MSAEGRFAAGLLQRSTWGFAAAVLDRLRADAADVLARMPATFADPAEDSAARLLVLAAAMAVDRPELFGHEVGWYRIAFAHREVPAAYLPAWLRAAEAALTAELPQRCHDVVGRHLRAARQQLDGAVTELPSLLAGDAPLLTEARQFLLAVLENRPADALALVEAAAARGVPIADLHDHVLAKVQAEMGRMWLMGEVPVADEHHGSRIVERAIARLLPVRAPAPGARRVLAFAVGGNLHDIGLRLVADRFTLAGWDVMLLGADTPASDLDWLLQDRTFDLIALSASLLLHLGNAEATIARLRHRLGQDCPPILVGGTPFRIVPDLARQIGADDWAADAATAVATAERLVPARRGPA